MGEQEQPQQRLTCLSCHHYEQAQTGQRPRKRRCNLNRQGCPKSGPTCAGFLYKPGRDER